MELSKDKIREIIAKRVAKEFQDGDVVNLGIGLPTEVVNYIPSSIYVALQSENGLIGMGETPSNENVDKRISNAGGSPVSITPGGCFFDSFTSFGIIRGGHVDATVLGALQVDEKGNLANWMVPGKMVPGMGGAMDLVVGAKKVIIAMEHTAKGNHKILKSCNLPLTAANEVNLIVTEKGVMEITEKGILLKEISPYSSIEDIILNTEATLIIDENLKTMEI